MRATITSSPLRRTTLVGLTALLTLTGACHLDWNAEAPPILPVSVDLPVARPQAPRVSPIDVEHYALDLTLHPETRSLDGSCTITFAAARRDLLRVDLDFAGLEVRAVSDELGRELPWQHEGETLTIDLPEVLIAGDAIALTVDYTGSPQKGLWFAGDRGGLPTHVFTQGECEDSSWWFPCWDAPSDFATTELRVTMPAKWVAMAAGERVERTVEGSRATEHWRMDQPHAVYLTTLVAGDFVVKEDRWRDVPLYYLAEPQYAKWMDASFSQTGDILTFMSDFTGLDYPYSKYSQACVENFPFGGMENITATTLTELTLDDERGNLDRQSHGLVAHEAAHQWFGNLITCADWSHIWLNEGFATYATLLYFEQRDGVDAFRIKVRDAQESYIQADSEERRPIVYSVYQDPMDLFGGHVYPGGASRLHLLRSIVGDDAFVAAIQDYVAINRGNPVKTSDLQSAFEDVTDKRLDWFFDQWLYSPGFPEFRVEWDWDVVGRRLNVRVAQTQTGATGEPRVFRTPVDIEVRDRGGRSTHRVWITERRHTFQFDLAHEPIWVRFDKYGWIPKKLDAIKAPAEWIAIAEEDDDVNGRRDAVLKLGELAAETLDVEQREIYRGEIAARLRAETNADVRAAAAKAGGMAGGLEIRAQLEEAATKDPEVKVRVAALTALEAYCPAPDLAQLAQDEFDVGLSWGTMGAAAGLFSRADPENAYAWLTAQLLLDSPHDQLRGHLLRHLGRLENRAVLGQLKGWAADFSTHPSVRAIAVEELAKHARGRASVSSFLVDLLDERNFRLRHAVVRALGGFGDPVSRRELFEYYGETVFPRDKRAIEAALGTGF